MSGAGQGGPSECGGWLAAQEEERRALARDLHDDVGQSLTALRMAALALLPELSGRNSQALAEDIVALAEDALGRVRAVAHGLHPPLLETLGLVAALASLCDGAARGTEVEIRLQADPALPATPPSIALTAYRIAQEALANALRHARAHRIDVRVVIEHGELRLLVADDGRGYDTATPAGFGRAAMRDRARLAGGSLREVSTPRGTRIEATLPLPPEVA